MKREEKILLLYLKDRYHHILIYSIFVSVFFIVFYLYKLPISTVIYATLICSAIAIVLIVYDFSKYRSKHHRLLDIKNNIAVTMENLPQAKTLEEVDYQNLIEILYKDKIDLISKSDKKHTDLIEYYTLWTHQIKTPISAIDFLLQSKDEDIYDDLELQIIEMEKYVDMALQYIRIDSMSSDLKLEKYSVQKIIKKAVKDYSKLFVYNNIKLNLDESDIEVITDEKWLLFVLKQILSNSLKYTDAGIISIYIKDGNLTIEDTGIGISQEDIPRLFERGFTGYNGRMNKKSTGLGLYLSKIILDNLGHKIRISSKVDIGTKVKIDLSSKKLEMK